jgi:hypothetical protein
VSFHTLTKFFRPTKAPGFPTVVLLSASQTPFTNGYAMKSPRSTMVGRSRSNPRTRSFSRRASWRRRPAAGAIVTATAA